jgi:RNA polymerase sigma factor (sigma-70 family)
MCNWRRRHFVSACHIASLSTVIALTAMRGTHLTAEDRDWLAERFEEHRTHLRAVGYRMLGSITEADDAVQEAWLRLSRSDAREIENLGGWLTTVVARVCLNMLHARKARREEPLGVHVPDPIVSREDESDPEQQALLADSVGLALLVVLDRLEPAERLAFVLHDMFGVPFDEISSILGRSPAAARQLASRARRRVQGAPLPDPDLGRQRQVVSAFLAAVRDGDFDALMDVLDPDVVLRADSGAVPAPATQELHGARAVAQLALAFSQVAHSSRPALVNRTAGLVTTTPRGELFSVQAFTIRDGKIVEIDILADPARLSRLDVTVLDEEHGSRPFPDSEA